jgi:pimeloyl-ACP methyl ester carboxylesterase
MIPAVVMVLAATAATMAGLQLPATAVDPPPVGEVVTPDGTRLHYEIRGKGPTIVVPALIVHGDKDPIPLASAYDWEKTFSRATVVPVAGAGHFPFVEQPQAVLRAIQPFVTAHPPSR